MRRFGTISPAVLLLISVACRPVDNPQGDQARMEKESAAFKQASATLERSYERFTNDGNPDSLPMLFAENGRQFPPNGPTISGRAAIREDQMKQMGAYTFNLKITSENATANGPVAIENGTYTLDGTPKNGAPAGTPAIKDDGKYLAHYHRTNGQWLIADLIWNSNRPLAMPAAAPAKKSTATKAPARKR